VTREGEERGRATAWRRPVIATLIVFLVAFGLQRACSIEERGDSKGVETAPGQPDDVARAPATPPPVSRPADTPPAQVDAETSTRTSSSNADEHAEAPKPATPASTALELRFVDAAELAIRDEWIGLWRASSSLPFAYFSAERTPYRQSTTDVDGRVRLDDVQPGSYFASLWHAPDSSSAEPSVRIGVHVEFATHSASPIEVVIPEPLYVTGTVSEEGGDRIGTYVVHVTSKAASGSLLAEFTESGEFRAGPLVPGDCTLQARDERRGVESDPVTTIAGRGGIDLVVRAPKRLSIRLEARERSNCQVAHIDVDCDAGISLATNIQAVRHCVYAFELPCLAPRGIIVLCDDGRMGTAALPTLGFDWRQPIDVLLVPAGSVSVRNEGSSPCTVALHSRDVRVATFDLAPGASESAMFPAGDMVVVVQVDGAERRSTEKVQKDGVTFVNIP
jgi:hypothetical protein